MKKFMSFDFLQDAFDVEGFCEMLSAYLPEFVNIDHGLVCEWIFQLSSLLSQKKFRGGCTKWFLRFAVQNLPIHDHFHFR